MVQNLLEVFSTQEIKVYRLKHVEKNSMKEIASILDCSLNTVKEYCRRIKVKATQLELLDNVKVSCDSTEIEEIFNEENNRTLAKRTIAQVQFLSDSNKMSCKRSPEAVRQMRQKTGTARTAINGPALSKRPRVITHIDPPSNALTTAYTQYNKMYENTTDIEKMAELEVFLRANGMLYRTPYINKLNRKTSLVMRAQETGYQAIIVMPGDGSLIPPGSKFVESVKDDQGHHEYSVWLFPKSFCCPKTKQKRKIV